MRFERFQRGEMIEHRGGDRRLAMLDIIGVDKSVFGSCRLAYEDERVSGWDHVQYLGEHMVSDDTLVGMMTSEKQ